MIHRASVQRLGDGADAIRFDALDVGAAVAVHLVCILRQRDRLEGRHLARAHLGEEGIELVFGEIVGVGAVRNLNHRAGAAGPEALGLLYREEAVGGGLARADSELVFEVMEHVVPATKLTRIARAHVEDELPFLLLEILRIERRDAIDFGIGELHRVGEEADDLRREIAEFLLRQPQPSHHRAIRRGIAADVRGNLLFFLVREHELFRGKGRAMVCRISHMRV